MIKVSLLEKKTTVYSETNEDAPSLCDLSQGQKIVLGKTIKVNGKEWVEAFPNENQKGYVLGNIRIYLIREVFLDQRHAEVFISPSYDSEVILTLKKKDIFTLITLSQDEEWVEILTEKLDKGYIHSSIRLKETNQDSLFAAENYKAFMLGVFLLGGMIALPFSYGNKLKMTYLESIPWAMGSCLVFLVAFQKKGNISWIKAIPAIILLIISAQYFTQATGKPSFAAGGIAGFLLILICGYLGIGIKKIITRKRSS